MCAIRVSLDYGMRFNYLHRSIRAQSSRSINNIRTIVAEISHGDAISIISPEIKCDSM